VLRVGCLLIGARGFLGRQINKNLRDRGIDVIGTTRVLADGDPGSWIRYEFLRDPIADQIRGLDFGFVIAAARLARVNVEANHRPGTEGLPLDQLFGQLARTRSSVTYISSDAVFSGTRGSYLETAEPDASEAYGLMQTIAERSITAHVPNHLIVRTSFLFNVDDVSSDRRLSRMRQVLTSRTPFFADTNVYKSPVRVTDAARVIVERTLARQTGIVHLLGKRQSVYEFYETSLEPLGLSQFREHLVARENVQPSDTSLRSMFERRAA
jgi:dTDP-4-dehydrorhamnose reductase